MNKFCFGAIYNGHLREKELGVSVQRRGASCPVSAVYTTIMLIDICTHGLGLKAGSGPDSAEATENTEWVRTEFTENYGKLRSSDTGIQRRYR